MKESYSEGLASHADPELYAGGGNIAGVATTGAQAGQVLSSEMRFYLCAHPVRIVGRQHRSLRSGEWRTDTAESKTLCMSGTSKRENREILFVSFIGGPPRLLRRNGQLTSPTGMLT